MKIVGITGSIGCGKTYLANIVKKLGFAVYNPDDWVRNMYKKKFFLSLVKNEFPQCFNNNDVLDKRKLRNIVFENKNKLKKLENIFHPFLKNKLKKIIKKHAIDTDIIFLDVALLYEMNWDIYCDYIIAADIDDDTQMQRVMKRDNITKEDFEKIIKVQNNKKDTKEKADFIINTGFTYGINKVQLIRFIEEVLL